ncbi:MAG: hypothetical protein J6Q13_04000 [Clostridia bacterium]|nr:hypothetical protein [Clostridia bacterium]
MEKTEIKHKLHDDICALDSTIKQLASFRPYIKTDLKQDKFDRQLQTLINIKYDLKKTLKELKEDISKQSESIEEKVL